MAIVQYKYSGGFGRAANGSGRLVAREMNELGNELADWIEDNTPTDTGESARRTAARVVGQSTQVRLHITGLAPYSMFSQQTGRKPGKAPAVLIMLALVRRKNITFQDRVNYVKKQRLKGRRYSKTIVHGPNLNMRTLARRRAALERKVKLEIKSANPAELRKQYAMAFLIGRAIGRDGIRGPLLFTRVLFVKRGAINAARARIERGIKELIEGKAA